ncbi:MAG: helicase RecD/TraA family protein [Myxococcales bacterium]|nr:helicase RecD/TraA family protein [Myxococcales bacterium]
MLATVASETLEGSVLRVVFTAPDGAFAVLRLKVKGRDEPVAVVGPLADSTEGELLKLEGFWERHSTHGDQFRATRAVVEMPRSKAGVARYLEALKGIGPVVAERLVAAFGVDAIEVMEKEPWRAAQVKGVGKRRAERAARDLAAKRQEREVMVFLQGLGVSLAYAARIRKAYGDEALTRVQENPYRLARDVPGIGFVVADRIAQGMGIARDSPLRIQAGVLHVLESLTDDGHVFFPKSELAARAAEALTIDLPRAEEAVVELARDGGAIIEGDAVYPPRLHRAEVELAKRIGQLLEAERGPAPSIVGAEALSEGQKLAIASCGEAGVVVITGGPGTGKTTVVRALVQTWERAGRRVMLAAPTGRAAKRLSEATGRPAQTVHRLLEWGKPQRDGDGRSRGGARPFGRGDDNPLQTELLVVDEASMLDLQLARGLVAAVRPGATLVLVGDVDQLPSVGPGQVLRDVIDSKRVPVARLREVFRQAEGSGIVENAYRILAGEMPIGSKEPRGDFFVVTADDPERAREMVVRLCKERIPSAFGLDPLRDVQVLSPMHRGAAGTEGLNRALQEALNPSGAAVEIAGAQTRTLRVGDKVMQVRNDYERDVFNGDVGVIAAARRDDDDEPIVEVDFDGRRVRYEADSLGELELAYAVSVHKSQGSEYPAVVIPLLMQHYLLLQRNLLYTAVTRGKRLVVLVGSDKAIRRAVGEAEAGGRHTGLRARLAGGDDKLVSP